MSEVSWEAEQDEILRRDEVNSSNKILSNPSSEAEEDGTRHRQLYVGNIPPDATVPQIQKLFEEFQPIARVDLKSGFAFVFLEDGEQAERAIRLLNGTKNEELFGFRTLKVEYAKDASLVKQREEERKRRAERNPTESLFVTNFPSYFRERDLERIFDQFGKVVNVEIIRSYAFVTFASIKDASFAYEKMHHFTLDDGRELHVEYVTANRVGRRLPRERESRFGYRRRSPRRHPSTSPPRRRAPRSRSGSLDREDKRRRLADYRVGSERKYYSRRTGARILSPQRERSPSRFVSEYSRMTRSPPVGRDLRREYRGDEKDRTMRRREIGGSNRNFSQEGGSPQYSHRRESPTPPRDRENSPITRRAAERRELPQRRIHSPVDSDYSRHRDKSGLPEASRREGYREVDREPHINHNGEGQARNRSFEE
ncbi:Serine/arginine-rich splicing factor RS31A [Galdieria sulphuraria]|nr:Serine/arginine-rich splicing factor RS31A [Galdieria sulphuraria]